MRLAPSLHRVGEEIVGCYLLGSAWTGGVAAAVAAARAVGIGHLARPKG